MALPKLFSDRVAAGFLLEKEIACLGDLLRHPQYPFMALIGGAKVSTKMGVLKSLVKHVNVLAIGGGMAFTFLKAQGIDAGHSLVEEDMLDQAKEIRAIWWK